MNSPDIGRGFEALPPSGNDVNKTPNVTLGGDNFKSSHLFPECNKILTNSLKHGSKTEQLLACFLLHGVVCKARAKQVYGETRLTQRVSDLTVAGLIVGRNYSQRGGRGVPKATYYLPEQSIPAAKTRINELRVFRKAQPIDWEVSA